MLLLSQLFLFFCHQFCRFLDIKSLCRLECTSRSMVDVISDSSVWRLVCLDCAGGSGGIEDDGRRRTNRRSLTDDEIWDENMPWMLNIQNGVRGQVHGMPMRCNEEESQTNDTEDSAPTANRTSRINKRTDSADCFSLSGITASCSSDFSRLSSDDKLINWSSLNSLRFDDAIEDKRRCSRSSSEDREFSWNDNYYYGRHLLLQRNQIVIGTEQEQLEQQQRQLMNTPASTSSQNNEELQSEQQQRQNNKLGLPPFPPYKLSLLTYLAQCARQRISLMKEKESLLRDIQHYRSELIELISLNRHSRLYGRLQQLLARRPDRSNELHELVEERQKEVEGRLKGLNDSICAALRRRR